MSSSRTTTLTSLSDEMLLEGVHALRRTERMTTLEILHHLNEIHRRKLYARLGFGSLFAYCTERLGYSSSAAGRRLQVARVMRRHGRVAAWLASGEVTLSTITLVAKVLTAENHEALLEAIRGKGQREVERIVARHGQPVRASDRVRPIRIADAPPSRAVPDQLALGEHLGRRFFGKSDQETVTPGC